MHQAFLCYANNSDSCVYFFEVEGGVFVGHAFRTPSLVIALDNNFDAHTGTLNAYGVVIDELESVF